MLTTLHTLFDEYKIPAGTPNAEVMKALAKQWHEGKRVCAESRVSEERNAMRILDLSK